MVPMNMKRNVINKLYSEISEPEISILLGARQVGKTTLMHQLERQARQNGLSTTFFDMESSADLAKLSGSDIEVFNKIVSSSQVVFIDEFHYLKNGSRLFKEIYDSGKKIKIYASGSSSLEIHKHLKESLAGRFRKTMIFPLSLDEASQIEGSNFENFLRWGGLPGLIHRKTDEEKMDLLENITSTYITKDIKGIIKEENIRAFNSMLYSLAQNQGSTTIAANIAREAGISESTVSSYLEILSETYVCHALNSYSNNLANELKKSKKHYLFDVGIRNSLLKDFRSHADREDKGIIFESFIFLNLIQKLKPNMEICFWRTKKGAEVDFIILKDRQPFPIEVKSDLKKLTPPKGLKSFLRAYPKAKVGFVFNAKLKGEIDFERRKIHFLPLEEINHIEDYFS